MANYRVVIVLRVRGKRYRRKLIKTRPLFRKRSLRSIASTKSSNAYRSYSRNFYKNNDVLAMALGVLTVAGLLAGALMFSVAVGVVLAGYLCLTKGGAGRKTENTTEASEDIEGEKIELALMEWDKKVKGMGGNTRDEWVEIMKRANKKK